MRLNGSKYRWAPLFWGVAVIALSAVFGYWNADTSPIRSVESSQARAITNGPSPAAFEQMELTLAQAGCPGWMVLASEGEAALQPAVDTAPSTTSPTNIQQTTYSVAANPAHATSARVANRLLFDAPQTTNAKLITGAADDPDDLLDGVPDLLAIPAEQKPAEESPQLPSTDEAPTASVPSNPPIAEPLPVRPEPRPKVTTQPPTVDHAIAPPKSEPKFNTPLEVEPNPKAFAPIAEPVLPGPTNEPEPTRSIQPQQTAPIEPRQTSPTPTKAIVPAPPKPSVEPRFERQRPPAREQIKAPRPQLINPTTPAQPKPQQSPFAPPPKPAQPTPHSVGPKASSTAAAKKKDAETKTYCEYLAESQYPSAFECAKCHEKIFDEWSISSHAYAAISPMFHKFEQTINDLSQGTVGYFCYRCHVPVGTNMGISRAAALWDLPQVAREGVTCIACHRVNQRYGKVNGHRRIEPGSIHDPVYGSIGGGGIAEVIAQKDKYKVKTSPHDKGPGQDIHVAGESFDQLGKSEFCVSCHQVAVHPGIKLEVVWEQYRASPACKKGVSCQDCHMGRIPGVPSGYEYGAAAVVNDKSVNKNRKHANHVFYGPGYSIAHPGVFPHNKEALRWQMQDWLTFNWRAGWGTDEFEEAVDDGHLHVSFPKVWSEADDRYDAREVIEDNLKKLDVKKLSRQQTMENGSHVDGPYFDTPLVRGQKLKFHYIMTNTNEGHNLPSGSLGAQPQLWANVVLIGPRGQRLWETGYTDSYGDVADIHSVDVRNKRIPYDWQLFNLQTMFLITGAKGTDREFFLPVNFDIDQLPYLRPGAQPTSVINHPPFIRMEGRSLAPLGSRKIPYQIPAELMREPGHYRLSFRLRSRAEPIYFMRFCGSTKEMNRAMNEWIVDFHESSVEFVVK